IRRGPPGGAAEKHPEVPDWLSAILPPSSPRAHTLAFGGNRFLGFLALRRGGGSRVKILLADFGFQLVGQFRALFEIGAGIVPALTQALVLPEKPGPRLFQYAGFHAHVQQAAFAVNALSVIPFKFGC